MLLESNGALTKLFSSDMHARSFAENENELKQNKAILGAEPWFETEAIGWSCVPAIVAFLPRESVIDLKPGFNR